jgi:hypothetical protein
VYGLKFLFGKRIVSGRLLAYDLFFGMSARVINRKYFTFWSHDAGTSWGLDKKVYGYPGIQAGLNLVFGSFKKK